MRGTEEFIFWTLGESTAVRVANLFVLDHVVSIMAASDVH